LGLGLEMNQSLLGLWCYRLTLLKVVFIIIVLLD
jgi:hypothetical protein